MPYPDPIPGELDWDSLTDAERAFFEDALSRLAVGQVFVHELTFSLPGDVFELVGTSVWVCEFSRFTVSGVRAALGRGYSPTDQDVIIDVNVGSGATPTFASIFTAPEDQPRVPVGLQIGPRVVPTAVSEFVQGDALTIDVDQAGGDSARDLVVSIFGIAHG